LWEVASVALDSAEFEEFDSGYDEDEAEAAESEQELGS
jgi:hypothetical protein